MIGFDCKSGCMGPGLASVLGLFFHFFEIFFVWCLVCWGLFFSVVWVDRLLIEHVSRSGVGRYGGTVEQENRRAGDRRK